MIAGPTGGPSCWPAEACAVPPAAITVSSIAIEAVSAARNLVHVS
jgi:hypothetical protein